MPTKKPSEDGQKPSRRQPATSPQDREQQMIEYADRLAEKQLLDGTASSQVMTHYLKLGTTRERLEQEKIHNENLRLQAQIAQIESQARAEDLMKELLDTMKIYAGVDDDDDL